MNLADVDFQEPKMLIDGEFVDSKSGETFESYNPATGDHLSNIPRGQAEAIVRDERDIVGVRGWIYKVCCFPLYLH